MYFSLSETLDIGLDTGSPLVHDYQELMPLKMNGTIKKVVFNVEDSNMADGMRFQIEKANSQYMMAIE